MKEKKSCFGLKRRLERELIQKSIMNISLSLSLVEEEVWKELLSPTKTLTCKYLDELENLLLLTFWSTIMDSFFGFLPEWLKEVESMEIFWKSQGKLRIEK